MLRKQMGTQKTDGLFGIKAWRTSGKGARECQGRMKNRFVGEHQCIQMSIDVASTDAAIIFCNLVKDHLSEIEVSRFREGSLF